MAMLVLTRRVGERIMIGDDLILEIVKIEPGKVRLGFVGDKNKYRIIRSELLTRKLPDAPDQQADGPTSGSPKPSEHPGSEQAGERSR